MNRDKFFARLGQAFYGCMLGSLLTLLTIVCISELKLGTILLGLFSLAGAIYFYGVAYFTFKNPVRAKCPLCNEVFLYGECLLSHLARSHGPVNVHVRMDPQRSSRVFVWKIHRHYIHLLSVKRVAFTTTDDEGAIDTDTALLEVGK